MVQAEVHLALFDEVTGHEYDADEDAEMADG